MLLGYYLCPNSENGALGNRHKKNTCLCKDTIKKKSKNRAGEMAQQRKTRLVTRDIKRKNKDYSKRVILLLGLGEPISAPLNTELKTPV